jgi:hypothetical protein
MAIDTIESPNSVTSTDIPHSDTLIERASRNVFSPGRNGYRCNTVFDGKTKDFSVLFNVPDANSMITTAGGNLPAVACKVEGVDVLLMSGKGSSYGTALNVPDL